MIKLVAIDEELHKAFCKYFNDVEDVEVFKGDIFNAKCETIVSPANSFGFMDGGLDLLISQNLGWDIQEKLQKKIKSSPMKELLIGESIVIETQDKATKRVICAPTMRVPMLLPEETLNPYLAMKAILGVLNSNKDIVDVAIPGLGTGVGGLNPYKVARQMREAYDDFSNEHFPETWVDACKDGWRLR